MRRRLSLLLVLLMAVVAITTRAPLPLVAQNCVNEAEVVEQALDPVSGVVAPDATFTASWEVRNSGDCTWNRTYRLVFVRGERMESPRTARLRSTVGPGNTLSVTMDLTAPSEAGRYEAVWQLRTPDGESFGPELELAIEVGEQSATATEVVLPEVLVFGGMGAPDDVSNLIYCLDGGALPEEPSVVVDYEALQYRYATLFVCSLSEGAIITAQVTSPEGISFQRSYVEDAPVTTTDDEGNELTGTILSINLAWLKQAPEGDWEVLVHGDGIEEQVLLSVPAYVPGEFDEEYPTLDNWPLTPVDPFAAAEGCHYIYRPGEAFMVGGANLPAAATLHLGIYQERLGNGYLAGKEIVQTDAEGAFTHRLTAPEPGSYNLVVVQQVNPEGYFEDGTQYEFNFSEESGAFSCFTVMAEARVTAATGSEATGENAGEADAIVPWRLAFATGTPGFSEIVVYDIDSNVGYYPTYTSNVCDTSEPAWWPDGAWVLYQSNCVTVQVDGYPSPTLGGDYDLYGRMIDPTYTLPEEETLVRLTATPELDETEPDANGDGLIVYRQAPAGTPLDTSGELWLLDIFAETTTPLGLSGRAPAWSPDGSRIALMSDIEGSWQIYVYDLAEETIRLVSSGCATHCRLPAWSPDGEQLIYHMSVSLEDFTPASLWMANVDSGTPRLWLAGEYARASWSAEGWIAFQGPGGIYRATPGRSPTVERYLYSNPEFATFWSPVWSR
jgi:hypothetical protein